MTVIDTSGLVELLVEGPAAAAVAQLVSSERELAAPDVVVFETLAVIRRAALRGSLSDSRAAAAVEDLGDAPLRIFPSLPLCARAWELRRNLTAADALFVALAETLGEPLATADRSLLSAVSLLRGAAVETISL